MGPGDGEKLRRSTAEGSKLSVSPFSNTLLVLLFGLIGLFFFAVPPSLAAPSNLMRLLVECYTGEDGARTCDVHFPPNQRVRREFKHNEGGDSEIWFTAEMCPVFERSLYFGEEGCPAQQYLFETMAQVQTVLEERHGSVSAFTGSEVGADWEEFPRDLRPESGVWPRQKPDGSDPDAARRANMYSFHCSGGPPVRCLLSFPPADVHKTPYERTNDRGETMIFTLIWPGDFNRRRGEDTPAEELIDRVLEYLLWMWNREELQDGIHPVYVYVPDGVRAFDHGRQLDFDSRELYRVGLSFWCGESTSGGRRCEVDLAPFKRVQEVKKLDEDTPEEIAFTIHMGRELHMYLNGDEEQQALAGEALHQLMETIRDDIIARCGPVADLSVDVGGSDWLEWPGSLHSDLGEHPADVPDPEESPDRAVRLGQYVYQCHPGPPVVTCFLLVALTSRVKREFIRNEGTEDQVLFTMYWDKAFQELLSDSSDFSPGRLLIERAMDAILYDWRFVQGGVDGMHYGDEVELQIRDLQQSLQGIMYISLPDPIQPEQLGSAVLITEVEGEGTVIE